MKKAQVKKGLPPCPGRRIKFRHVRAGLAKLKEVPVVLNTNSNFEIAPVWDAPVWDAPVWDAQKPLPRFGPGACLLPVPQAAAPLANGVVAFQRPSTARTAPSAGFGQHCGLTVSGRPASGVAGGSAAADLAANGIAASDQQSAYNKTLTIADGAGDLGPHPAREPV
jgi:hypothetical protein